MQSLQKSNELFHVQPDNDNGMTKDFLEIARAATASTTASSSINIIAMCVVFGSFAICVGAAAVVIVVKKRKARNGYVCLLLVYAVAQLSIRCRFRVCQKLPHACATLHS